MQHKVFIFLTVLAVNLSFSQSNNPLIASDFKQQRQWVDSVYTSMSLEQKIGQLFMVDLFSNASSSEIEQVKSAIKKYHLGGIIFSKGTAPQQVELTNTFQNLANVPLLIGMDAEWGLSMRLDDGFSFPYNMALGATTNNQTIFEIGQQLAKHSKRIGVHVNFAPVVDLNTNPKNPIIGNRSFGENKERVTQKALALMKGFQSENVLANAKHFPGHGDTDQDSHKTLPSLDFDYDRLASVEMFPYKKLFKEGLSSVMVAHLNVPSLTQEQGLPTSLSKKVVDTLLKQKLGFSGLVFTDALNMNGASQYGSNGQVELKAFLAGSDVLLIPGDVGAAVLAIKKAYHSNKITNKRLAQSVKKILYAKYKVGLNKFKPIITQGLAEDIATLTNKATRFKAFKEAITLVKNDLNSIPIANTPYTKIAYVKFGEATNQVFVKTLKSYAEVTVIDAKHPDLLDQLQYMDYVIVGHHKSDENPWKSFDLSTVEINLLDAIARKNKLIFVNFASPYALLGINTFLPVNVILQAYQNAPDAQQVAAEIIFGASTAQGRLPVSITQAFPEGTGYTNLKLGRLSQNHPQNLGFNVKKLSKIDSLVQVVLDQEMSPGLQVLIAKDGEIFYDQSLGYHTYDRRTKVKPTDVYDLASLTKILSTLPLLMRLVEEDQVDIDAPLAELLPELDTTNKRDISIKRMLSHYAGLQAWIPFYIKTMDSLDAYYSTSTSKKFSINVADNFYLRTDYKDSIYAEIASSELLETLEYKYSDLPFYFLKRYLEHTYRDSLHTVIEKDFYEPMFINNMFFYPQRHKPLSEIIPTEYDDVWRKQLVHGYVHDQGAAMLGGVGGHAGLFGNARSVAKLMQLYLNEGRFGGRRYITPNTINVFNTCYYCEDEVRRGLGFDKPQLDEVGPTCGCLSMTSFGHSGFTGTYTWADPSTGILYVFLSNRIHPNASNRLLIEQDIRTKIQQVIYEAYEGE